MRTSCSSRLGVPSDREWCEQLRDAAYADAVIATSSAVPAHMLALHDRSSESSADRVTR